MPFDRSSKYQTHIVKHLVYKRFRVKEGRAKEFNYKLRGKLYIKSNEDCLVS